MPTRSRAGLEVVSRASPAESWTRAIWCKRRCAAQLIDAETWARYRAGLKHLTARERRLIVGRAELGYSFRQLALMERQSSPDAARMALRRVLVKLSKAMPDG